MSTQETLGIITVVLIIVGGVWGVIKALLARDRRAIDREAEAAAKANTEDRAALWRRLDELRGQVVQIQIEQGVLRERVHSMPDHDVLHERFEAMNAKLEKKLDHVSKQLQEAIQMASSKLRCPHDPGPDARVTWPGGPLPTRD